MFGRKLFGNKKPAIEEPKRPATPPRGQIFNAELFEGERGEFLRKLGYAPDDPRNQAPNVQPLSVLLAEDESKLRFSTEAVNKVSDFPIVPVHLLPVRLWHMGAGPWLRQHLDLSPHRPWNVIFLPGDEKGAAALGLPVAPTGKDEPEHFDQARAIISCVQDFYAGKSAPDVEAMLITLRSVCTNAPAAIPPEKADFSDRVREARTHIRAAAYLYAIVSNKVSAEAILKSHATFLGQPEDQLIA